MNAFDIIGPVMVGPSSSHTAGVVRIGGIVRKMLACAPKKAVVKFHGSFSTTYKGHGSDKAIAGGLLGYGTDDERIRDSLALAEKQGLRLRFETVSLANAHPNTVIVEAESENGRAVSVVAESVGGGNIMIRRMNGVEVAFDGQYDTLIIGHEDAPGAVAIVAGALSGRGINIAKMKVYRDRKGGDAIMIIEADGKLDENLSEALEKLQHIRAATVIAGLEKVGGETLW